MSHSELEPQVPANARLVSVDGKRYPLESAYLLARAEGGMAMSTLAQTFANPYAEPLEVVCTMPLPADGAVLGYTITIGERVVRSCFGDNHPRRSASVPRPDASAIDLSLSTCRHLRQVELAAEWQRYTTAGGCSQQ